MGASLIAFIQNLSVKLPLVPFAFLGSILEEIISPIPSPLIMTTVGSALAARAVAPWYLFAGTVFAATVGKVLGYWAIYTIADRLEDVFFKRFGSKLGVSHEQIENFGKRFTRTWRDDVFVFFVRFLPILPSAPITVTAGIIKLPLRNFLFFSFLGTLCRNVMYLVVGYAGLEALRGLFSGFQRTEQYIEVAIGVVLAGLIFWAWRRRRRSGQ